ncbi:type VII secretion system-associated protein [Actinosynnema sp. CS-041913]|uniref:type VII secretion system-associated protein n=1 Tax=Actinosynnema sp. CS-041913 TaxID=3239917 RepID=UPI003D8C03BB
MDADTGARTASENWLLLMDPVWQPVTDNDPPPTDAVVGLWPVEDHDRLGKFRANPDYRPSDEDSPTDPLDTVLRLVLMDRATTVHIQLMLRDAFFDIAVDADGRPLVRTSPDDIPCVVLATSEPHRARVTSPDWSRVDLIELATLLADDIDVLINPGGPAEVRLTGDFIRETVLLNDEDLRTATPDSGDTGGLRMARWEVPEDRAPGPKTGG